MELLAYYPSATPALQRAWQTVAPSVRLDVLDLLRQGTPESEVLELLPHATSVEEFANVNPLLAAVRMYNKASENAYLFKPTAQEGGDICPRCKSTNTKYYEKQVRSADEPMTRFLTCNACLNRWREG